MDLKKLFELYIATYHSLYDHNYSRPEASTHHERMAATYAFCHHKNAQEPWSFETFGKYVK